MLTLFGSLLGFITSAFPDLLKIYQDKQDRNHELEIMDRQMEQMRLGHTQRLEEISINADIAESQALYKHDSNPSGIRWIDGLRSSVRPVITYASSMLFAQVNINVLFYLLSKMNMDFAIAIQKIWDAETQALFAACISYWFGSRSLAKARGG